MNKKVSDKPTVAVTGSDRLVGEIAGVLSEEDSFLLEEIERKELLQRVKDGSLDCIISGECLEILKRVRDRGAELPFVLVSDGSTDKSEAAQAGATEYVEVPIGSGEEEMLRRRVQGYVRTGRTVVEMSEADTEVADAKARYEAFLDEATVLVGVLDTDGKVLDINPKNVEYLETDPDEVIGKQFWKAPWWDSETEYLIMEKVERASTGEYTEYEVEHEVPERGRHLSKGFVFPLTNESGETQSVLVSSFSISEKERRELETERSLDILRHTEHLADTGGWGLDVHEKALYWTDGTRSIHRVSEDYTPTFEEAIEFYHPDDRENIREAVNNCIENGEPYDKELRIITPDDELRWIRTMGEPVEEDGEVIKLRGAVQDITERKERESELERYERLWENLPVGVFREKADPDRGFVRVNERMVEMAGAESEKDLLDISSKEFWTDEKDFTEMLNRVRENGWITHESKFKNLDGNLIWARVTVIANETEEGVVFDGVAQDITDRRQREEQLRKSEEVAGMGSWYMDLSSDRIFWSERVYELWGIDYMGPMEYEVFLHDYVHPDDEEFLERNRDEAKEGEPYDIEYRLIMDDDEVRWMREAAEVTFKNGEPTVAIGVIQDISDRKEREEVLERRKEQVKFFSHLLRHQMLNSITVVRGNAEMVLETVSEDAECYEEVKRIYERSNEMAETINRIRSALKRIQKRNERELTPENLRKTIEDSIESLREEHEVRVTTDIPEEAYVSADEFLGDVIDNVLANAVEHNDKDEPEVEVEVEEGTEETTVRIADNGPGIPEERKEDVFHEGVTGNTSGNLGFGLYFVDSMVSEYGGDVWVKDNEPEGAVFVVELPNAGDFGGDRG